MASKKKNARAKSKPTKRGKGKASPATPKKRALTPAQRGALTRAANKRAREAETAKLAAKRSRAAKKAAATRRERKREAELKAAKRSRAAHRGWKTKRAKAGALVTPGDVTPSPVYYRGPKAENVAKLLGDEPRPLNREQQLSDDIGRMLAKPDDQWSASEWRIFAGHLRQDGTFGKNFSRLRGLTDLQPIIDQLQRARDEGGEIGFDERVAILAEEFDVETREVYTLFFS